MSKSFQRRLCRKFINQTGIEVDLKRFNGQIELDIYGEPVDGNVNLPVTRKIKIVVHRDKRRVEETVVGGLPDNGGKEVLQFYFSGSEDVKTGDKIVYPPNTETEWVVVFIEPTLIFGQNIMNEAKANRDARY